MPPINVLLTGLPSTSTLCFRVGDVNHPLDQASLTAAVTAATGLPSPSFYLRHAGVLLSPDSFVTQIGQHTAFVELFLRRALPGGKGGFGATLKGSSATKVTTNFDACRDLHGRRIRDVREEAALRQYLSTHGPPKTRKQAPKKRPRTPDSHDDDVTSKVDTGELDDTIDAVTREVEDAVAAGLRARSQQRKKHRVPHSSGSRVETHMTDLLLKSGSLSSESKGSDTKADVRDRKDSSIGSTQS